MITITDKRLDKKNIARAAEVLAAAFKDDSLYKVIFNNQKELLVYMRFLVAYYNKRGEIHEAFDGDNIAAVAVWNTRGVPLVSIRNMLKSGMLADVLRFFMTTRISSIKKLNREVLLTERFHYNREHNYLFIIGSQVKGAGSALMRYAIKKFGDCPIYLENSNPAENREFYKKLGFSLIQTINVMGVPVDLLLNSKGDGTNEKPDSKCIDG